MPSVKPGSNVCKANVLPAELSLGPTPFKINGNEELILDQEQKNGTVISFRVKLSRRSQPSGIRLEKAITWTDFQT